MQILTVDIGTGTQDIFLYDARLDIENGYKLVVPSPTMMVHNRLLDATRRRKAVLLTGVIMGGGPSQWAAENHLRAGLPVFATPQAARTFNDDLDVVVDLGVQVVSEDEALRLPDDILRVELRDFDFNAIEYSFAQFGVSLNTLSAVGVGVFDHGDSPPGYSDRQFRFDYLDQRIRQENRLSAFAYRASEVPKIMTRLEAVVTSAAQIDAPLVVMDTAPAAVLGAGYDQKVRNLVRRLIVNVGNFHTLAFRVGARGIEGVFEHHTGLINREKLDRLIRSLAEGTLTNEQVFNDHGHGALIYDPDPYSLDKGDFGVVVTGPRRNMMYNSQWRPHFAAPFGDMMIAGCFGLLSSIADLLPDLREPIVTSLDGAGGSGTPPWEL